MTLISGDVFKAASFGQIRLSVSSNYLACFVDEGASSIVIENLLNNLRHVKMLLTLKSSNKLLYEIKYIAVKFRYFFIEGKTIQKLNLNPYLPVKNCSGHSLI